MIYIIIILVSMMAIAGINMVFNVYSLPYWKIVLAVVIATVAVIIVDSIFATLIRRGLPSKWFNKDVNFFYPSKRECRFYEKLGVKKWKDKVIELGCFTAFRKNRLRDPKNNEYVERFILECNYGYIVHIACIVMGYLIIFIYPLYVAINFAIPVATVNLILNLLPAIILRYNVSKLKVLYRLNERNNSKTKI